MGDTEITDALVSAFEAAYLAELYPDGRDFALSSPGNRHFESYRAGLRAVMATLERQGRKCYLAKQDDGGNVFWWNGREWSADKSSRMGVRL